MEIPPTRIAAVSLYPWDLMTRASIAPNINWMLVRNTMFLNLVNLANSRFATKATMKVTDTTYP